MSHYNNVLLMLTRKSFMMGDSLGLMSHMLTYKRFSEMIETLIEGERARWWLSTRLLLGLSHDDALRMGRDL